MTVWVIGEKSTRIFGLFDYYVLRCGNLVCSESGIMGEMLSAEIFNNYEKYYVAEIEGVDITIQGDYHDLARSPLKVSSDKYISITDYKISKWVPIKEFVVGREYSAVRYNWRMLYYIREVCKSKHLDEPIIWEACLQNWEAYKLCRPFSSSRRIVELVAPQFKRYRGPDKVEARDYHEMEISLMKKVCEFSLFHLFRELFIEKRFYFLAEFSQLVPMVQYDGSLLEILRNHIDLTYEICEAAVDNCPSAFRFVPPSLVTKELILKAVSRDPTMIKFIHPEVTFTAEFIHEISSVVGSKKKIHKHVADKLIQYAISQKEICPITFEAITSENAIVTDCGHIYNKDGFSYDRIIRCPVCREAF